MEDFLKITIFEIPKVNSGKQSNIRLESFFSTRWAFELPAFHPVLEQSLQVSTCHLTGNWKKKMEVLGEAQ